MKQITFTLRTLTPLFIAGADQTKAELRAPTFRGLMRYWLRTSLGDLVEPGSKDTQRVAKAEAAVFGTTDTGSPIQVRILNAPEKTEVLEREGRTREDATGRDYLFWSVLRSKRRHIPPQATFQVVLSTQSHNEDRGQEALERAVGAFWLLTHLGGMGSRSRRCAGSLSITHVQGNVFDFPFDTPTSVAGLQAQIEQGITRARKLSSQTGPRQEAFFDTLASDTCRIWILLDNSNRPWMDANQALRDIGKKLQSYRETLPIEQRKIFGIPVMVLDNGHSSRLPIRGAGSESKRIASPIHLRLSELQIGQTKRYVGITTLFKTRWEDMSEEDYKLYKLIESWVVRQFPNALEVKL